MFKNPIAFHLVTSVLHLVTTKKIQVLFGKQADEGTSFCLKKLSLLEAFLYKRISFLFLFSLFFPDFYFFVPLMQIWVLFL